MRIIARLYFWTGVGYSSRRPEDPILLDWWTLSSYDTKARMAWLSCGACLMEKSPTDLVSVLRPFISQNRLFLGALRHIGFNTWIHFYHISGESTTLIDVAMFDTIDEMVLDDIVCPATLLRVLDVNISNTDPRGERSLVIRLEESGNVKERKIVFDALAFHVAVKPVHKLPENSA